MGSQRAGHDWATEQQWRDHRGTPERKTLKVKERWRQQMEWQTGRGVLIQAWPHQWDALIIALILSLYPIRTLFYYMTDSQFSRICNQLIHLWALLFHVLRQNSGRRKKPKWTWWLKAEFNQKKLIKWPHIWVFFIQQAVSVIKTTQPQNLHDKVEISEKSKLFLQNSGLPWLPELS